MMRFSTRPRSLMLLIGGVLLGLALRPSQPVAASLECLPLITRGALVEVRRVQGDGAVDAQQMVWHGSMQLTLPEAEVSLTDATLPNKTFHVIPEGP
jgi:hypothetical protein